MRSVLITGGTGSLGRALVTALLAGPTERIAILSRDEAKHADLLAQFDNDERIRSFLGDVRDLGRLRLAMRGVDTVIHAAALKRVDALERDVLEAVKTNVTGSANVIEAALWSDTVEQCVLVSSDKATAPRNAYGATKLCAEKLFLASNAYAGPRFACVRYGNVAGSRGSVIPTWLQLQALGKPLPITDPSMTRFWIRMSEAVELVLWTLGQRVAGAVVIPKLPSFRVTDLWHAMHCPSQQHVEPGPVTGIRPGEKLHEALIGRDEAAMTVDLGPYYALRHPESTISGTPVDRPEYTSDVNDRWLDTRLLRLELVGMGLARVATGVA